VVVELAVIALTQHLLCHLVLQLQLAQVVLAVMSRQQTATLQLFQQFHHLAVAEVQHLFLLLEQMLVEMVVQAVARLLRQELET
jgi:hypothetical protein